ncbi:AtpZ/AtpI family protein [Patescibacteria group bacterium]|nr:AtpZ/AtpI family protein [Patescibacteria group bacterium]
MSTPILDPKQLLLIALTTEIFFTIMGPLFAFSLLGWWLDGVFHLRPWLLIASFPFAVGTVWLAVRKRSPIWYNRLGESRPS